MSSQVPYSPPHHHHTMQRLLKYFKGASDSGEKLNLTTPTVVAFHLTEDQKGTEKQYTFGYYLPHHIAVRKYCFRIVEG